MAVEPSQDEDSLLTRKSSSFLLPTGNSGLSQWCCSNPDCPQSPQPPQDRFNKYQPTTKIPSTTNPKDFPQNWIN